MRFLLNLLNPTAPTVPATPIPAPQPHAPLPDRLERYSRKILELMANRNLEGTEVSLKHTLIDTLTQQLPELHQQILKCLASMYGSSDRTWLQNKLYLATETEFSLTTLESKLEDLAALEILETDWWREALNPQQRDRHWKLSKLGIEIVRVLNPNTFEPNLPSPPIPNTYRQVSEAMQLGAYRYWLTPAIKPKHAPCLRCQYYNQNRYLPCAVRPGLWNWKKNNCPDFNGPSQPTLQEVLPNNTKLQQHIKSLQTVAHALQPSLEGVDFTSIDMPTAWRWLNLIEAQQIVEYAIQSLQSASSLPVQSEQSYRQQLLWREAESLVWQKNPMRPELEDSQD